MSKRTEQVAELLRSEINNLLLRDFEAPAGILVSVSYVTVSPDLKNATAYISIIPGDKLGTGLKAVQQFAGHIQKLIGRNLKMRNTPKLNFALDERDRKYKAIDDALNS